MGQKYFKTCETLLSKPFNKVLGNQTQGAIYSNALLEKILTA